jgi:hypothetical protein
MQQTLFTTIVVRRADGKSEIIGRAGHADPNVAARLFEGLRGGKVVAVRHEQVNPNQGARRTIGIHRI